MKVLLTSTSFQDSSGAHKELLEEQGWLVEYMRGPLTKLEIIAVIERYDALICGDDVIDKDVLERGSQGRLKFISKYGVGLDKIDLLAAADLGIPVRNCVGVNQVAVAEHVLGLLFSFAKNIHVSHNITRKSKWIRPVGRELSGKKIGIVGLGAIGKELAKRTVALGMDTRVYDIHLDDNFIQNHDIGVCSTIEELFGMCDFISLHVPLNENTEGLITREILVDVIKKGAVLINTSRGGILNEHDVAFSIDIGHLGGYLTDVLETEPITSDCVLMDYEKVLITPHIGSRTGETIERQGLMAVKNLVSLVNRH